MGTKVISVTSLDGETLYTAAQVASDEQATFAARELRKFARTKLASHLIADGYTFSPDFAAEAWSIFTTVDTPVEQVAA